MSEVDPRSAARLLADGGCRSLAVAGTLTLDPKTPIPRLPDELSAVALVARDCVWLRALPSVLELSGRLDVSGCLDLTRLPDRLRLTSLVMRGCTAIETLPEDLELSFLDATDCTAFARWPVRGSFRHGHLRLRNCAALRNLPPWIESVAQLDLAGCVGMSELPSGLKVTSSIDVADTLLRSLPPHLAHVELRWRGAPVDERVAFHPETITGDEVLSEPNVELRRVKLARMGYERFFRETGAKAVDRDRDRGGPRELLRVELAGDEPLVCLSVLCPSTQRRYVLRVPPTIMRCHDAAAWIAGYDDPSLYTPELET